MHKIALFEKYSKQHCSKFNKIICFEGNSSSIASIYSSSRSMLFKFDECYVLMAARSGEVELLLKSIDYSKVFVYFYKGNIEYIKKLNALFPKITIVNSNTNPKISLEIKSGKFKWEKYDYFSLPKSDKNTEGNKPTS